MSGKFMVERFLFVMAAFVGLVILAHALITKVLEVVFNIDYLFASLASGAVLLAALYVMAVFNKKLEKQVGNFLYFKGKRHYHSLLKDAITDGLTDLYDRRYFELRLADEIDRSKRYNKAISLLMVDIDNFKEYNDTFGHLEGDKVLIKMGEAFKKLTRKVDIPARYGGEEFVIILPETDKEGAKTVAERLRAHVEGLKFKDSFSITISIGICTFGAGSATFRREDILKSADEALYRAKAKGKNRVDML